MPARDAVSTLWHSKISDNESTIGPGSEARVRTRVTRVLLKLQYLLGANGIHVILGPQVEGCADPLAESGLISVCAALPGSLAMTSR